MLVEVFLGFANLMNKKAKELGLENTHFETPHGLDSAEHYTTAYELALLSNYALKNKTFAQIVGTKNYTITINGAPKQLSNTNELLGNFAGVYGIKTGFTNGANRCLVTACKRNDIDVITVVLGADTKKFRTQDSIKLLNYALENFQNVDLDKIVTKEFEDWKSLNLNKFNIEKGISQSVSLKLANIENKTIPIRKDLINSITVDINCSTSLIAPVKSGYEVGSLVLYCNGTEFNRLSIFFDNDILKKSPFNYFLSFFKDFNKIVKSCLNI